MWEEIILAYSLAQVSHERGERIWSYHGAEMHNHTKQLGLESGFGCWVMVIMERH